MTKAKTKTADTSKITADDLFVGISWCDVDPHAEDYQALQRVKKFLEIQLRRMEAQKKFP